MAKYHQELDKNKLRFTILNARMSNKSFFWWRTNFFTKHTFHKVSSCTTQDEISRNRFEELEFKKLNVVAILNFLTVN